jgi:hypothetical protein
MTGVVLALAGLAGADGGPGGGAARAEAAVSFAGEWVGTWRSRKGRAHGADLCGGEVRAYRPNGRAVFTLRVVAEGPGRLRITDGRGRTWLGLYRLEGACLRICSAASYEAPRPLSFLDPDTDLFTLRPAALPRP